MKISTKSYWFLIIITLAIATVLRFYQLGVVPSSLYWDEAAILLDAWSVGVTGRDWLGHSWLQQIFLSYGDYKLPAYIWFSTLAVELLGVSNISVRLVSALVGMSTVIVSFFLVKDLWILFAKEKISPARVKLLQIASLLVAATSYWSIHFSRTGFEAHLGQLLLTLVVWLVVRTILAKKLIKLTVGLIFVSSFLAVFTYFSVRFVMPGVVVSLLLCLLVFARKQVKRSLLPVSVGLVSLLLSIFVFNLSPLAAGNEQFRLSTDSLLNTNQHILLANQIQAELGSGLISRILYHRETFRAVALFHNLSQHLSIDFLYLSGDANLRHGTGEFGLFSLYLLPFLLLGIYQSFRKAPDLIIFLLSWWFIALIPAAIPQEVPHALRSLNALEPLILVHALGIYYFWISLKPNLAGKLLFHSSYLILFTSSAIFFYHYLTQYPVDSAQSWQAGYAQVADFIVKNNHEYDQVWALTFDGRWFLWLLLAQSQPPTQLEKLVRSDVNILSLNNIYLSEPDCPALDQPKTLVVGKQDQVSQLIERCRVTPMSQQVIFSIDQLKTDNPPIFIGASL